MNYTDRELIKGYVQKAGKKLEVAKRLFANGDYEDSVSRAYYAVYHAAQGLLLTEGERASTHKGVLTLFSLLFVKTGRFKKNLGKYLSNLKDDRENGDYEIFSFIDEETAETALNEAEEFIKETIAYLQKSALLD
ncbi:HEPN domain-containing protein [Candidatus Magnetominusculus dajiuhuensis]|uniref:HEPN domain-containing protein n=1 Tax=Candidatus Magnetominusculus dajiuhuensis TaxID=3137712 RepID=UPI003B433D4E